MRKLAIVVMVILLVNICGCCFEARNSEHLARAEAFRAELDTIRLELALLMKSMEQVNREIIALKEETGAELGDLFLLPEGSSLIDSINLGD